MTSWLALTLPAVPCAPAGLAGMPQMSDEEMMEAVMGSTGGRGVQGAGLWLVQEPGGCVQDGPGCVPGCSSWCWHSTAGHPLPMHSCCV